MSLPRIAKKIPGAKVDSHSSKCLLVPKDQDKEGEELDYSDKEKDLVEYQIKFFRYFRELPNPEESQIYTHLFLEGNGGVAFRHIDGAVEITAIKESGKSKTWVIHDKSIKADPNYKNIGYYGRITDNVMNKWDKFLGLDLDGAPVFDFFDKLTRDLAEDEKTNWLKGYKFEWKNGVPFDIDIREQLHWVSTGSDYSERFECTIDFLYNGKTTNKEDKFTNKTGELEPYTGDDSEIIEELKKYGSPNCLPKDIKRKANVKSKRAAKKARK